MDGIYEVSSSEKVKSLEEDLRKELKELQNEVEEGNFLSSVPKAFGWVIRDQFFIFSYLTDIHLILLSFISCLILTVNKLDSIVEKFIYRSLI